MIIRKCDKQKKDTGRTRRQQELTTTSGMKGKNEKNDMVFVYRVKLPEWSSILEIEMFTQNIPTVHTRSDFIDKREDLIDKRISKMVP